MYLDNVSSEAKGSCIIIEVGPTYTVRLFCVGQNSRAISFDQLTFHLFLVFRKNIMLVKLASCIKWNVSIVETLNTHLTSEYVWCFYEVLILDLTPA